MKKYTSLNSRPWNFELWESIDELWLGFEIVVIGFWELNARRKGCLNEIEPILQRYW